MLHGVVETFLDSLSEREFDAPLLALLAANGCYDVHFMHGAFEFGKDVIAKRRDTETGKVFQLAIQSKAGDINQHAWRAVRPQLDECEYDTRSHPSYDEDLPRVAVLVTTGRLVGGAAGSAQAYRTSCQSRGLADVEFWTRDTILGWVVDNPATAFAGTAVDHDLLALVAAIGGGEVREPDLERYTRRWVDTDTGAGAPARAALETALLGHALCAARRADLAALTALHLLRAVAAQDPDGRDHLTSDLGAAAVRMFVGYATTVLGHLEPLLADPTDLARPMMSPYAAATYPAACCRLLEVTALLALTSPEPDIAARARAATVELATKHPGAARPPSDAFAVAIIPTVCVLAVHDPAAAAHYLRRVAQWTLDRHDDHLAGLGLGGIDESEEHVIERLLAGALTSTTLDRRTGSYVMSVVLDMLLVLGEASLYDGVLGQAEAVQMHATGVYADEYRARWRRSGAIWPQPNITYESASGTAPPHHAATGRDALTDLLLTAVTRNRHHPAAVTSLIRAARDD